MEPLSWIGFGTFFVASLVIGTRLLLLARRTGELPELLIGVAVLGIGPLGVGLSTLALVAEARSTILSATLQGSSFVAIFMGAAAQYLFVWYVFRRQTPGVRPLVFAVIALMATGYVADILESGLVHRRFEGFWFGVGVTLRLAVVAWTTVEALLYWKRMRRRLRLGLADPLVTNRFLLWGLGSAAAFLGSAIGLALVAITGTSSLEIPGWNAIISLHGLAAAIAMWLAFQPPTRYRRFIENRARPGAAAARLPPA
jgi:hypothetical protein